MNSFVEWQSIPRYIWRELFHYISERWGSDIETVTWWAEEKSEEWFNLYDGTPFMVQFGLLLLPGWFARSCAYKLFLLLWFMYMYVCMQILPKIKEQEVVHFNKTDFRLVNNGIPIEFQKLRCQVNYEALRFTPTIAEVGKKIVKLLRQRGPFLVLHLRYEMDMLAFSGCNEGCNETEADELTKLRWVVFVS